MDGIVIGNALAAFFLFIILHIAFFRFVNDARILKWLKRLTALSFTANLMLNIYQGSIFGLSHGQTILCVGLSASILLLLLMIYVTGIFGLVEAAIRMRIMWELYKVFPQSMTSDELFQHYNVEAMIQRRLDRLTVAKEIVMKDHYYYLGRQMNYFFFSEWTGNFFNSLLGRKTKIDR